MMMYQVIFRHDMDSWCLGPPPNLDHHCNALGRGILSLVSFQGATHPRRAMLMASCMVGVGSFWSPFPSLCCCPKVLLEDSGAARLLPALGSRGGGTPGGWGECR